MKTQTYYAARFVGDNEDGLIWGCGDSFENCLAEFKISYSAYLNDMTERDWDSLEISECTKEFYDMYFKIGADLPWREIDGILICMLKSELIFPGENLSV